MNKTVLHLLFFAILVTSGCTKETIFARRMEGIWQIEQDDINSVTGSQTFNFVNTNAGTFEFEKDDKGKETGPRDSGSVIQEFVWTNNDAETVTLKYENDSTVIWTVQEDEKTKQIWKNEVTSSRIVGGITLETTTTTIRTLSQ